MRHVISVLVDNEPGVLSRISGLFSGRAFNIESLNVAETLDPTISRMTLVTAGSDEIIEQITKQLNKLIDVVKLIDTKVSSDMVLRIGGRKKYKCRPGLIGNRVAVQIGEKIEEVPDELLISKRSEEEL